MNGRKRKGNRDEKIETKGEREREKRLGEVRRID